MHGLTYTANSSRGNAQDLLVGFCRRDWAWAFA